MKKVLLLMLIFCGSFISCDVLNTEGDPTPASESESEDPGPDIDVVILSDKTS